MEFDIPARNLHKVDPRMQDSLKIAKKFSTELKNELGMLVKAVILFGSRARNAPRAKSDIDILVIIDDLSSVITQDLSDAYRMVAHKIILRVSRRIHLVTLRLTSFWEYIRNGDPIGINMLRDGVALHDVGVFEPLQLLLKKGKIRPTKESIWAYFVKAPATISNSKWHLMQAVVDLYWAVIDSAHAALMSRGAVPPTPEHVGDMLDEVMVNTGLLEKKYSDMMRFFYDKAKAIMHREISEVKGEEYDKYLADASDFVNRMKEFIK